MIFVDKIKTVRKINVFEIIHPKYVRYKITPDSSVRNNRTEDIVKSIAEQYKLPIDRFIHNGMIIRGIKVQERFAFEIAFENERVSFYFYCPEPIAPLMFRRISSVWDKATIEEVEMDKNFDEKSTQIYQLVYKKHDIYALHTDANDNLPLNSLIESGKLVGNDERAKVFAYFEPIYQLAWQNEMSESWRKLTSGISPRKWNGNLKNIAIAAGVSVAKLLGELVNGMASVFSNENTSSNIYNKQHSDPMASRFSIEHLTPATRQKRSKMGIKTYLYTIAESENEQRADMIARTLATSFNDLSGDNELEPRKIQSKHKKSDVLNVINTRRPPKINFGANYMSTAEASKIVQIPGKELQRNYPEIDRIDTLETQIDNKLLDENGIYLGTTRYKGKRLKIYHPISDHDELCLPHIGIGGMGQGKTKGLLSNWVVETVKKGFGCIAIDPAKGEIGDQVEKCLSPDKIIRMNLGNMVFSLDWCEALHHEKARARLAGTIVSFFNINEETTGQTERYLRAAVMAMKTGRVIELFKIFQDTNYLEQVTKDMPEGMNKTTLEDLLNKLKNGKGSSILNPIYNRLNMIMSDPHLFECMESENSLDFVDLLTQRKAIIIDVPDTDCDPTAKDIIVNLVASKIDLAMRLREKVHGKGSEFPFFICLDEPHQYLKSANIWTRAVVESRKYKVGYFWTFHYWEQIPTTFQKGIKNALPHYFLYPSSKLTFKSLDEEIKPFELEDALKIKRWHALTLIRSGGEPLKPFVCKMAKPPAERKH